MSSPNPVSTGHDTVITVRRNHSDCEVCSVCHNEALKLEAVTQHHGYIGVILSVGYSVRVIRPVSGGNDQHYDSIRVILIIGYTICARLVSKGHDIASSVHWSLFECGVSSLCHSEAL
jgi:hypothetical protein